MTPGEPKRPQVWVMAKGYAPDEGGMQSYAQGVAEAYAAAGLDVTVFGQSAAGPRRERVGAVRLIDVGPGKSVAVPWKLLTAMRQQLRRTGGPIFVHGTTWRTSLLPWLLRLSYVTTFHGREFMGGGAVARRVMLRLVRDAKAVVTVSRYSAVRLRRRLGPACPEPMVLGNGLSVSAIPSERPGSALDAPVTILSVCRLEPRKNIAAGVRACAVLRQEGLQFRYLVAGRGPEFEALRAQVRDAGLQRCVKILGKVPSARLSGLYTCADIFLHPQVGIDDERDFEGFGITVADAMAAGLATIAGTHGGPGDIIQDGETGLLVDGEDDEAVTAALRTLVSRSDLRRKLGRAGREHALATFRWDRHAAAILDRLAVGREIPR